MIDINKDPSRRELAWFGLIFLAFWTLVGLLAWLRFDAFGLGVILWSIAALITALYYAVPPLRKGVYLGWIYATYPIGWTIFHLVLAIAWYMVLTPIGLVIRAAGKDPMHRAFDKNAATYWINHEQVSDKSRYFRQF